MVKKSDKKIISKKNKKKKCLFDNIISFVKNHLKLICICVAICILVILLIVFILNISKKHSMNKVVLSIDDMEYTRSDFNIYFYSVKYDYFGKDVDKVSDDNMKIVVSSDDKKTLGEYLKEKTVDEIKTATVIKELAAKYNLDLDDDDYNQIKKDKNKFIKSIGGRSKFNKLLKDNTTTELAYDKMAQTDMLYTKIVKKIYGEDKRKDLTDDELKDASKNYENSYFKIEQIILTTIDMDTRKSLSDTEINQKKTLAKTIYEMAKNGDDFDKLIKKYSEDATDKEKPYYHYYKSGQLLQPIEEAILKLNDNEISEVIETDYAFHIVKKLKLDDSKYNEYLDGLREEKALKDIKESFDSLKVIYRDEYKKN